MVKFICVQYCKLAYRCKMQMLPPPSPQVHDSPPLPYMGLHPINFLVFMGFSLKSCKLREIYGMHAHINKNAFQ